MEILQIFLAFSEYMNFNKNDYLRVEDKRTILWEVQTKPWDFDKTEISDFFSSHLIEILSEIQQKIGLPL